MSVESRHSGSLEDLDVLLAVPLLGLDERLIHLRIAPQILLRERRPMIRQVLLGADDRDLAVGVALADMLRGGGARQPASNQNVTHRRPSVIV